MPTFGNTGAGTQDNFFLEGNTFGSKFTLTEAGFLTSMTVRVVSADSTIGNVRGRVYADVAGTPDALIHQTDLRSILTSDTGLQSFTFSSPAYLPAGDYWLVISSGSGTNFACRGDSTPGLSKLQAAANPDPFVPTVTFEGTSCIYATYFVPSRAPVFVQAGTGVAITGTSGTVSITGCTAGNLLILNVLEVTANTNPAIDTVTNITNLAGTTDEMTYAVSQDVGWPTPAGQQNMWLGRVTADGTCSANVTVAANDLYCIFYEFSGVSTGTTVATVIENAGDPYGGFSNTEATVYDRSVQTNGPDRLALNIISVNDDLAIADFTGETGGNWAQPVAAYTSSAGTPDGCQAIQTASLPNAGTIDGGTFTISLSADYGVTGFALIPAPVSGYQRIAGPLQLAAAAETLYTVPTGMKAELRSVDLNNPSGSTSKVTMSVGTDAAATRVLELVDIPAGGSLNLRRGINHTLVAGEVLQAFTSPVTFVRELGSLNTNAGSGATQAVSVAQNATAGNTVILAFMARDTSTAGISVADSRTNTWTVDAGPLNTANDLVFIASTRQNVAPLQAGDTVTITFGTAPNQARLAWLEEFFSSLVAGNVDVTASNSDGAGVTLTGDTGTTAATAAAGELAISAFCLGETQSSVTHNGATTVGTYLTFPAGGFQASGAADFPKTAVAGYQITGAAAAQKEAISWSPTMGGYQSLIVVYLPAALTADFNLGTNGATVAASDTASQDQFDLVSIGSNATLTYDNSRYHSSPLSMKVNSGTIATNNTAWVLWDDSFGPFSEHYGRFYINPDVGWDAAAGDGLIFFGSSGAQGGLVLASSLRFQIGDAAGLTGTFTASLTQDVWTRVEYHVIHSATVGMMEVKFFTGTNIDGTVADSTAATAANRNFGTSTSQVQIGMLNNDPNVVYWIDDLVMGASSYPGPALPPVITVNANVEEL